MEELALSYRQHRYPAEVIAHCVRLYYPFPLSRRGVEELLFERGVIVSYESIRRWCHTFGRVIAAELRRRRPQPQGKWHIDEVFIKLSGKTQYLWRAVDADGMVLDSLMQDRRNQAAAEALLRRLVDGNPERPRLVVTDKLASYRPAIQQVPPETEHSKHKGLNNRVEHAYQPTRQRERAMRRFTSPTQAQRCPASFGPIREHVCPKRHRLSGSDYRAILTTRFATCEDVTGSSVSQKRPLLAGTHDLKHPLLSSSPVT